MMSLSPAFSSCLWLIFSCLQAVLGPIVGGRGLSHAVPAKALESPDPRTALKAVLRAWLPLSEAVLGMAVTHLPSPAVAAPARVPHLLSVGSTNIALLGDRAGLSGAAGSSIGETEADQQQQQPNGASGAAAESSSGVDHQQQQQQSSQLTEAAAAEVQQQLERTFSHLCASSSSSAAPLVVFVSKMVSVPANLLPRSPGEEVSASNAAGEVFLAFGRVFSGVAREGMRVHVLSTAYDPHQPGRQRQTAVLRGLYLMMGRWGTHKAQVQYWC